MTVMIKYARIFWYSLIYFDGAISESRQKSPDIIVESQLNHVIKIVTFNMLVFEVELPQTWKTGKSQRKM